MNFFLTEENSTSTSGLQPNGHALKSNRALPIWRGNTLPQGTVGRNIGCFNPESREVAAILLVKIFIKETCVSHLRSLWFATRWHDSCTQVYRNLGWPYRWCLPEYQGTIAYRSCQCRTHYDPTHLSLLQLVFVPLVVFSEVKTLFS